MADDFQTGVCSGNWWNPARTGSFDASSATAVVSSVSCSTAIGEMGSMGWSSAAHEIIESKARSSCNESQVASVSGSSVVTFQDAQRSGGTTSLPMVTTGFLMDSFGLSSPTMDWNQNFLRSSSGRGHESNNFHGMIQEDSMSSTKPYLMEPNSQVHPGMVEDSTANLFKNMNQTFLQIDQQQHLNTDINEPSSAAMNAFPPVILQGLYDQEARAPYQHQNTHDAGYSQQSWSKFPPFFKPSQPMKQQLPPSSTGQLHFANNAPYWNPPAAAAHDARGGFYPPGMMTQYFSQAIEGKSSISSNSTITTKSNSEGASSTVAKKNATEPSAFKKPRIETASPVPTFKKQLLVRKEKLGDRITALQQLVSPFGKTDTASVLYEAIEYIKFLHDQVNVLSTPYLKNGHPMQHQQTSDHTTDSEGPKKDLRSRGLCLVPISSTFPVANEPMSEFWTPTFGGSYR